MKPLTTKLLLLAAAAALLVVGVEAQQSVRAKKAGALSSQAFGFGMAFGGTGGNTGGSGGVIVGPAPGVLSPIDVDVPLP